MFRQQPFHEQQVSTAHPETEAQLIFGQREQQNQLHQHRMQKHHCLFMFLPEMQIARLRCIAIQEYHFIVLAEQSTLASSTPASAPS
jgi:hypothetical protein